MNYQTSTRTQAIVMRRVHAIHLMQSFLAPAALAAFIFVLALWGIGREVWIGHVVQNFDFALHAGTVLTYLKAAFLDTRFIVQALVIATFAAGAWLAYSIAQLLRNQFSFRM